MGEAMLPNHPCYQLHHTRILNFPVLLSVGIHVVKGEFEAGIYDGAFQYVLLSQRLPGLYLKVVGCRTHLPKADALRPDSKIYYKLKIRLLQEFLACGILKK